MFRRPVADVEQVLEAQCGAATEAVAECKVCSEFVTQGDRVAPAEEAGIYLRTKSCHWQGGGEMRLERGLKRQRMGS